MKPLAPYQIFFPLGFLNALIGVSVWFVKELNWFQSPSLLIHSKLISGGFLWSFVVGFLMTALPRMTGTKTANKVEYFFSVFLMLMLMYFSWQIDPRPFYATHMGLVLFLIFYGGLRVLKSSKTIPVFFSHVGLGLLLSILGAFFYFRGNSYMGLHLYHIGTVLLLVLGIGTRFFSFLSGLPSVFENEIAKWKRWSFHGMAVLMAVFLFLAGKGWSWAYLGLTALTLIYLFAIWKVQRPAERLSPLKYGARIVALMIPSSFFLAWLQPALFVTWFHLLFIGCFSIITFSVATRVTLAHGSYSTDLETKSKSLWWMLALMVCALLARIGYGFAQDLWWKKAWMHFAATFWVAAILVWCFSHLRKIFTPGPEAKPSC